MFHKFDINNSGQIEINELFKMFKANGVQITMNELKKLFSIVDSDKSGAISIQEFKKISQNSVANELFRTWIKKLRKPNRKNLSLGYFLPFNLNRLLDHLSTMTKRDNLVDRIDKHKLDHSHTEANIRNFIKLFILDESSKESCIKEE